MWKLEAGNLAPSPVATVKEVAVEVISAAKVDLALFLILRNAIFFNRLILAQYYFNTFPTLDLFS